MGRTWHRLPDAAKLAIGAAVAYLGVMSVIGLLVLIHVVPMWLWGKPGASTAWTVTAFVLISAAVSWYFRWRRRNSVVNHRAVRRRLPAARAGVARRPRLVSWASLRLLWRSL